MEFGTAGKSNKQTNKNKNKVKYIAAASFML